MVVAPRASELIHPVAIAVAERLTADQLAHAFTVYPSMSGSVAEAAGGCTVFQRRCPSDLPVFVSAAISHAGTVVAVLACSAIAVLFVAGCADAAPGPPST